MQYIAIEGNIGAGKTSLAEILSERFQARIIHEQFSDNPFLPGFYADPVRYAFPLELSFLAGRYNQLKDQLLEPDLFRPLTIADYYFGKSLIFAGRTLGGHEFNLFRQLFEIMNNLLPKPDLFVYLHREPSLLLRNIRKRGRHYEQGIESEYLEGIQQGYFDFMKQMKNMKFLVVDVGNSDFINEGAVFEKLVHLIFSKEYAVGISRVVL